MPEHRQLNPLSRAVLLAAALLLFGLLFQQLVTLLIAILITILLRDPARAAARPGSRRYKVPRAIGALVGPDHRGRHLRRPACPDHPVLRRPGRRSSSTRSRRSSTTSRRPSPTSRARSPARWALEVQEFLAALHRRPGRVHRPARVARAERGRGDRRARPDADHGVLHGGPARPAHRRRRGALPARSPRLGADPASDRLRASWIGWMEGVVFDMVLTGVLLYVGLIADRPGLRRLLRRLLRDPRADPVLRRDHRGDPADALRAHRLARDRRC